MDELIIPASYFYLLYLYVFNDFQIGSLQKIHKFIFFIFQNRAGELTATHLHRYRFWGISKRVWTSMMWNC